MYFESIKREKGKKKPKVFLAWLRKRIQKNQNCIILFNGATGSAKSYASITLAHDTSQMFGTPFTIKDNLEFNFTKLLQKMQLPHNQKPGTVFVMEEVGSFGSGASSREWQSQANKFFFSFLQTSRHRNQILILNCPSFSYLEKGSRELVHFQFESMGIDHRKKLSYFKPFAIQCNRRTGKLYFKFLRYKYNGMMRARKKMSFRMPPQDLLNLYEIEKLKFTTELNRRMIEGDDKRKPVPTLTTTGKNRREIVDKLRGTGMTSNEIAELIGISVRNVDRHLKIARAGMKT